VTAPETLDSHVHVGITKYGPVEPYLETMDRVGLRRAVLVQYVWNEENGYLEACVRRWPERFAAVAIVDPRGPDAGARVRRLVERGAARGLRVAPSMLTGAGVRAGWWEAVETGDLTISVTGPFDELIEPGLAATIAAHPTVRFRLEHLGGFQHAASPGRARFRRFLGLADRPNTFTMWSGFWLNAADGYPYRSARPALRDSLAAFGADRICWSGDWNRPGIDDATYLREANLAEIADLRGERELEAILAGTALRLFRFAPAAISEPDRHGGRPRADRRELPNEQVVE
jgi:predicted TIM-barrel fold metal-dependent hydrolase